MDPLGVQRLQQLLQQSLLQSQPTATSTTEPAAEPTDTMSSDGPSGDTTPAAESSTEPNIIIHFSFVTRNSFLVKKTYYAMPKFFNKISENKIFSIFALKMVYIHAFINKTFIRIQKFHQ